MKKEHLQKQGNYMFNKKEMTKAQALAKLTALCAKGEHCRHDVEEKMRRWELPDDVQAEVMAYLVAERFIDEARFARAFIHDKMEYNHWGRRKVEQALRMKRIDESIYKPLLDEADSEADHLATLIPMLRKKAMTTRAGSEYELHTKLFRFALSRGFTYEQIDEAMNELSKSFENFR